MKAHHESARTDAGSERVFVTGATGYLGGYLVRELARAGSEVHTLVRDRSVPKAKSLERLGVVVHGSDGSTARMVDIVRSVRPDLVFHLAAYFVGRHKPEDVVPLIESNILLGTQLLEAMADSGTSRIVTAGTTWQHSHDGKDLPVGLYAATKQAFDDLCAFYAGTYGVTTATLKLCDTYGPDDPRPKLVNLLMSLDPEDKPLDMSPGEQLIDLVHVDDVVAAFIRAGSWTEVAEPSEHRSFLVSSGSPISLKRLIREVSSALGYELPVNLGGRPYRPREIMVPWTGGEGVPGWEPEVSLAEGLRSLVAGATEIRATSGR